MRLAVVARLSRGSARPRCQSARPCFACARTIVGWSQERTARRARRALARMSPGVGGSGTANRACASTNLSGRAADARTRLLPHGRCREGDDERDSLIGRAAAWSRRCSLRASRAIRARPAFDGAQHVGVVPERRRRLTGVTCGRTPIARAGRAPAAVGCEDRARLRPHAHACQFGQLVQRVARPRQT
jgi:hypothetical protein